MKLASGFSLVLILMIGLWIVALDGLGTVVTTYDKDVLRVNQNRSDIHTVQYAVTEEGRAALAYLLTDDPRYREDFEKAKALAEEMLANLHERGLSVDAQQHVANISDAKDALEALVAGILARTDIGVGEARDLANVALFEARSAVLDATNQLVQYQIEQVDAARDLAEAANGSARSLMVTFAVIAVVAGAAVAVVLTRGISNPIRRMAEEALRLADGDLKIQQLNVRSRDEIGDLAGAFNRMVANLRRVIEQIQQTSAALMDSGNKLLTVADESTEATAQIAAAVTQVAQGTANQVDQVQDTRTAMEQLQRAIDQIASGAQEQAHQAEQTTRTLEQMAKSIEQVTASAQEVAEASGLGAERARLGEESVGHVVDGMNQIRASVARVAQRIEELGDYSRQIGQIVGMISDIADQTNLLALNAAIEAARAGEHGRGFGVVAEEVRQLAERSAESTREIGQLIGNIQSAVEAAVHDMEAGTSHVETGTELTGQARTALNEILEAINRTDNLARTISEASAEMAAASPEMLAAMAEMASVTEENTAATEEMAASSEQVMRAMDEVASISEETAAGTEEVSASTEEVNAAAEDMKSSVQTLTDIATNLDELVAQFQL